MNQNLKSKFCLAMAFVFISFAAAQGKKINELTSFELRNSGPMMDKEKNVDGYYLFYKMDELKKKQAEYAIQILDANLNEIAKKSYVAHRGSSLIDGKFNNQALLFATGSQREGFYHAVAFDRKGEEIKNIKIESNPKAMLWMSEYMAQNMLNMLFTVDNKGFLFNRLLENKKMGYGLKYIPTDGGQEWEYRSAKDANEIMTINPIEANEEVVVALEMSKKNRLSKTFDMKVVVLDIHTGTLLFEREFGQDEDPRLITNAVLTDEKSLVLMGEYFEKGKNIYSSKSQGLFAETTDLKGNQLKDSKVSWEGKINKMLASANNSEEGKKDKGYIYFHDVIRSQKGTYYAIGERFRKTASAAGIATMVLSRGAGNSTQLTITDAVVFEFDKDFELLEANIFEKGKSRVPIPSIVMGPQISAHFINSMGGFDYEFTQLDLKRDRFYSYFTDFERIKGEKNKWAFKSIMQKDGQLVQDKIYLEKPGKKVSRSTMPGKLGHVLILDYDRKEKSLDMHLEKMNFDTEMSK